VQAVNVRDKHWWGKEEEEDMAKDEIRAPQSKFDNLDNEFTSRL